MIKNQFSFNSRILIITLAILLACPCMIVGQTREAGPYWPNSEWGAEDEAGASNRINPQKILDALKLATTGK
ncbi:MAG: hypothetical protein ACR2MM_10000, partial [Flavobacteriaceae bacterium]